MSSDPLADDIANRLDNILRLAAYDLLQGMTLEQSLAFLANDGFVCQRFTCTTEVIQHLGWPSVTIAVPGYRGRHETYVLTLPQGQIVDPDDISADARIETILWPCGPRAASAPTTRHRLEQVR